MTKPQSGAAGQMGGLYRIITGSHYLILLVAVLWALYFILCWMMKMIRTPIPLCGMETREVGLAGIPVRGNYPDRLCPL